MLTVLFGGARSGKSALAQRLALAAQRDVVYVATAVVGDEEMHQRVERHRQERPRQWSLVEAPMDLSAALRQTSTMSCVIVDCVTLWLTNRMLAGEGEATILTELSTAIDCCDARSVIMVSNEVGMGIVPDNPLGREFRDLQGRANQLLSSRSDRCALVVAGMVVDLVPAVDRFEELK